MNSTPSFRRITLLLILVGISLSTRWYGVSKAQVENESRIISPLPTPVVSRYVQVAIEYLARKYNIPQERLVAEYEVKQAYPLSGRSFQYFKISEWSLLGSTTFNVWVDVDSLLFQIIPQLSGNELLV